MIEVEFGYAPPTVIHESSGRGWVVLSWGSGNVRLRSAVRERLMDPTAMHPYGAALAAYYAGDPDVTLLVRRDDGLETSMPVSFFFRTSDQFTPIESAALDLCRGSVLDVGAGSGVHSLVLQSRVTA